MEGLFEQLTAMNRAKIEDMRIGRAQHARAVLAWINKTGLHTFGSVPIRELVALCNKEIQP